MVREGIASFEFGNYVLGGDLKSLIRVREAGAAEGGIFYCARILEALTSAAMARVGLPGSSAVISNLETLQQFNLVPAATRYWAHGLRRVGNDVRHVVRAVSETDADLAMIFVERWLAWFFCEFVAGPKLRGLTVDGEGLFFIVDQPLLEIVRRCERGDVDAEDGAIFSSPAVAGLVAENLIERKEHEPAARVLREAVGRFGVDVRLRQLDGLLLSRMGKLETAVAVLEPLYRKYRDDPETAGILGGVYKRLGETEKSYAVYREGWDRLHGSSAYLGINAAAVLLFLGRGKESRALAQEVRELVEGRLKKLAKYIDDASSRMDFWDRVILAEADLLVGDVQSARKRYQVAFADFAGRLDVGDGARGQGGEILQALGSPISTDELWNPKDPHPNPPPEYQGRG